jgi:diacylglycerol kinase (ATP)
LVVPAGSGNDLARALGLLRVRDSLAAWRRFVSGAKNVRTIDLGSITPLSNVEEGKTFFFSCAAGVGLDGEIARRANVLPRWLRAHGGYALSLPSALLYFKPFQLTLSAVDPKAPGDTSSEMRNAVTAAIFANAPFYGGGMKIAPRANMADGALDTCVIRDISKLKLASVFPSVYFGRHLGIRQVEYFPIERARVETETPLDVYADGEYVCRTPVEIGVAKCALRVIRTESSTL